RGARAGRRVHKPGFGRDRDRSAQHAVRPAPGACLRLWVADRNRGDRRNRHLRPSRPELRLQALHSLAGGVRARDLARFAAFALAVLAYRRRKPSKESVAEPKWLSRVEGTHWLL